MQTEAHRFPSIAIPTMQTETRRARWKALPEQTRVQHNQGDAVYSSAASGLDLNAYLANPAGELKYYDRNLYSPIMDNYHVPEGGPWITTIATGLPN